MARCTRYACLDQNFRSAQYFRQGDNAHFFFEFVLAEDVDFVTGGVQFNHEHGFVAYARSSFQQPDDCPTDLRAGSVLRFHHTVALHLEPATYSVDLGIATTDKSSYFRYRSGLPGEPLNFRELSRVRAAFRIEIDKPDSGNLRHYGLAGLPDSTSVQVVSPANVITLAKPAPRALRPEPEPWPTVLHITHWKAGSQWIRKILDACAPGRTIAPEPAEAQIRHYPVRAGHVYPTVYLSHTDLDRVALPPDTRKFVVIRDLRDTLVSGYFSFKSSHPIVTPLNQSMRDHLESLDFESGMLHLMDRFATICADIQLSWLEAGEPLIRYEDLLDADVEILTDTLLNRCGLPVAPEILQKAILSCRFESMAGRPRGQEDRSAHERKGVAGDWRNHFTPRLVQAFKARFGGLLVATGYESSLDW